VTTSGFGLSRQDLERETQRFGVAEEQVRRDHAISHVLAAISKSARDDVIFFGGTALSRTHLLHARLSEDIDLIALGDRREIAERIARSIDAALLRTHGRLTWSPPFGARDIEPAVVGTPTGISIRVQLLDKRGYERWPAELRPIEQRYGDAPAATLVVPTVESFAAWKTAAWHSRAAPRDLYDLWALADADAITPGAAELFIRHGPTGGPPRDFMFTKAPDEAEWQASISGQTRLAVTAAEALTTVRSEWARAVARLKG
jgi:hypothetical protein